jgi:hypothetical protein
MRAAWWLIGLTACGPSKDTGPEPTETAAPTTPPTDTDTDTDTTPPEPTCAVTSVAATASEELVTEVFVAFETDAAVPVDVWCTTADDPDEAVLASAAVGVGEVVVRGLLAETEWTCAAHALCDDGTVGIAETTVTTGELPSLLPNWSTYQNNLMDMSGAYTLFNDSEICEGGTDTDRLVIVDPKGRVRWYHVIPEDLEADVDANYVGDGEIYYGGGWGLFDEGGDNRGAARLLSLSNEVLYEREEPAFGLGFNHHSELLSDGTYLSLTTSKHDDGTGDDMYGVAIEVFDPATESIVWSWDSAIAVATGILEPTWSSLDGRLNANSVTAIEDEDGPAFYVSEYYGSHIFRVDRATGDVTWVLGPGGDFDLYDADGTPLSDEDWFYNQHEPEWDGTRVLMHDNGTDRPIDIEDRFSRALELEIDVSAWSATILWSWTEDEWFEPILGDADRLPNGNVLVTQGHCSCCWWRGFGNPAGHESALVEVEPVSGDVAWRMDWPDTDAGGFRAERYDGCEIFSNAAYCPSIAAMR